MPTVTYTDALDGANLVVAETIGGVEYLAVWHGGTYTNVYAVGPSGDLEEVEGFSLSDDEGRPVERERMAVHAREYLEAIPTK